MGAISTETGTYLANLVDPEVMSALVQKKLINKIKFAPLATIDTTLVGQPGSTVKMPSYNYIGKAVVTPEGNEIEIKQLTAGTVSVEIEKVANGVELTDEAVLSGFGDPLGEAADQLTLSIADAIDDKLVDALNYKKKNDEDVTPVAMFQAVATQGKVVADDVANGVTKFGEDLEGGMVILVNPADYANLRKASSWLPASEISANIIIKGAVGEVYGCQVVVTNRVEAGTAFIVKAGALAIFLKRDTMIESDRDIIRKSTVLTVDKHMAIYLKDASKVVKLGTATA